jgi:spore coat protein U-like protein
MAALRKMAIDKRLVFGLMTAVSACMSPAIAGQKNDGFQARVAVVKKCTVIADDVNFGTINQVTGTETATGQIRILCSKTTPFSISMNATRSVTALNTQLLPLIATNPDRVRARVTLSGSGGTGTGLATSNTITYNIGGTITANPLARPDTYRRNLTLYINY